MPNTKPIGFSNKGTWGAIGIVLALLVSLAGIATVWGAYGETLVSHDQRLFAVERCIREDFQGIRRDVANMQRSLGRIEGKLDVERESK